MQSQGAYMQHPQPPRSNTQAGAGAANQYTFPAPSPSAVNSIRYDERSFSSRIGSPDTFVGLPSHGRGGGWYNGLNGYLNPAMQDSRDSTRNSSSFSHYPSPSPSLPPTRHSTPALVDQRSQSPFPTGGDPYRGFTTPSSSFPNAAASTSQPPFSSSSTPRQFFKALPSISPPQPVLYGSGSYQSSVRDRVAPERVVLQPFHNPTSKTTAHLPLQPLTWEEPQICDNVDARSIRTSASSPLSPISTPADQGDESSSLGSSLARNLSSTVTQASDAALDALLEPLVPGFSKTPEAPHPSATDSNQPVSQALDSGAITPRSISPSPAQVGTSSRNPSWSVVEESSEQEPSAPKASMGAAEKELKKYTTDRKLVKAVAEFVKNYDEAVVTLATNLKVDPGRIRKLIGFHRRERTKKDPTPYQAGLFKKAQSVNEDREKGDRVKLKDMHRLLQNDKKMMAEIEKGLKSTEVQQWIAELKAIREERFIGERGSEKAIAREATSTMEHVKLEMENMSRSTGAFTFAFMCRSEFGSSVSPAYWGLGPIEDFLWVKFKMTGFDFVSSAQAFACLEAAGGGDDVKKGRSKKEKFNALRKIATTMISNGLHEILGSAVKNVKMEYKHYEVRLVKVHGVKLVNWPADIPFDSPSNIRNDDQAHTIYDLVRSGTIRWEKLSKSARAREVERIDRQIQEGKLQPPTRAERSDKGGTHKKRARDSDAVEAEDNSHDTPPPLSKRAKQSSQKPRVQKRKTAPTPAPKSREFVESDSEEENRDTTERATVTSTPNPTFAPSQPSHPSNQSLSSGTQNHFNTPSSSGHNDEDSSNPDKENEHTRLDALRAANPGLDDDELRELLEDPDADDDDGEMDELFGGNDGLDDL
ncbi:hypothetical protein AAF712_015330 [Marasmius tenuissimus]|uniref:Uncharacterized protein n=1 Tax=Marasmius tenuissimus TaxID=585030 RepID=A0ABR2Z8N0_9AGAR